MFSGQSRQTSPCQLVALLSLLLLSACSSSPKLPDKQARPAYARIEDQHLANEIVLQAMALLDTGYKFGGRNPEAGLDCSGMVSLVVERASGKRLPHNAAQIAAISRKIPSEQAKPGDFVFFNTNGAPYSHMGIYLGDGRFLHAPSSRGKVRVDKLNQAYYAQRFSATHTLFE